MKVYQDNLECLKIPVIELPEFSYIQHVMNDFYAKVVSETDNTIKLALIRNGIDPDDICFLKQNIQRILIEGDSFEHYFYRYGTPEEKRIISIEKEFTINQGSTDNKHTMSAYKKYY